MKKFQMLGNIVFGVLLIVLEKSGLVFTQSCSSVTYQESHCASSGDVTISCPIGFIVDILLATPRTLKEPGCNTTMEAAWNACEIEPLTTYVENILCYQTQSCTISASVFGSISVSRCSDYLGENILYYEYRCEPTALRQEALCAPTSWWVTSMQLGPNLLAFTSFITSSYVRTLDCACKVTLPANTEMAIVKSLYLTRNSTSPNDCAQRLAVSDDTGVITKVCASSDIYSVVPCEDYERDVYFAYVSDNPHVEATFRVDAYVGHTEAVLLQCGIQYGISTSAPVTTTMAATTTTLATSTTTTVPPTTTNPPTTTTIATTTVQPTTKEPTTTTTEPTTTTTEPTTTTTEPTTTTTQPPSTSTTLTTPSTTADFTTENAEIATSNITSFATSADDDNSNYLMFGMTRGMFIGAIAGGLALIMIASIGAVIAKSHSCRRSPPSPDDSANSQVNIPENIYEDPDLPYNTYSQPIDPPTGFDPPVPPPSRPSNIPPPEENIYSTLPGDRMSGDIGNTPYDPYSNDDEPDIAHNPLYGRSSAIFSYPGY